jgi:hypothetical protein
VSGNRNLPRPPPYASFLILFFGDREKAGTAKAATNGKTMTITTPNNLVAKLAAKLKGTIDTPSEQNSNLFGIWCSDPSPQIRNLNKNNQKFLLHNDLKSGLLCGWNTSRR